jgi:RNA polymerase sigma-70 factor (sigma-E family)
VTNATEFTEFASVASPRLRRTAFLLCGNWHTAEDLSQTTLAKVFASWPRIRRRDAAYTYATRTLVNVYLADRRLRRNSEVLTDRLPERPAGQGAPETRIMLLGALATLPPRSRATLILRYWADLNVDQVAAALDCSPGTVKSTTARALTRLRVVLGSDDVAEETNEVRRLRHG